jgi:hypothetical protein
MYNFARYSLYAVSNTIAEVTESLFKGLSELINLVRATNTTEIAEPNDIEAEKEYLYNINTLVGSLDAQNKIWMDIVVLELKQSENEFKLIHNVKETKETQLLNLDDNIIPEQDNESEGEGSDIDIANEANIQQPEQHECRVCKTRK